MPVTAQQHPPRAAPEHHPRLTLTNHLLTLCSSSFQLATPTKKKKKSIKMPGQLGPVKYSINSLALQHVS